MSLTTLPAETLDRFVAHDGWAIASHIALSALMSLFPFLIIVTALAGVFGSEQLADEVGRLLVEAWPREVAQPIAGEIRSVMSGVRRDALAIGALLALWFASSGVEAVRIGLNRAYEGYEWRSWWITRLESMAFVLVAALAMIGFAFLIILFPLGWRTLMRWAPWVGPAGALFGFGRIVLAGLLAAATLALAHRMLPAERLPWRALLPGILFTLAVWLIGGLTFGAYLDAFASAYVTTYAGLATAMIALVFLYLLAAIFLFGAELNGALLDRRRDRPDVRAALTRF